jgi:glycosyltransferase involved in cell wall biosynthesis
MMHVLVIPSWYPRSPLDPNGSFFREQAAALKRDGCTVGVIYPELRSLREWRTLATGKRGVTFEVDEDVPTYRSHGMNWFPRLFVPAAKLYVRHGLVLYRRYVKEHGVPDVVHAHSLIYAGGIAFSIHKAFGVPFVVTEHASAFARGMVSRSGVEAARRFCSTASRKFAVSDAFARFLNQLLCPDNAEPWEYLPNLVSNTFENCRSATGPRNPAFTFVTVGFMKPGKRQANILRAFAKIRQHGPRGHLVLVGDGPERTRLEALSRSLGLNSHVTFTGILPRHRVAEEMAKADAFVLASEYETFGVVVIEALSLGKPVVCTRCGGPDGIVTEGDGLLVDVDDVKSLSEAMSSISSAPDRYDPAQIRSRCIARFGERAVIDRLTRAYESVRAETARG